MSNLQKCSPNLAYLNNLAIVTACVDLGAAAVQKVMGTDAVSNQIAGETQSTRDIQEMIGARLTKAFGA